MIGRSVAAILVVVVVVGWYVLLPPATIELALPPGLQPPIRGAIHVHTQRSDGTGTLESVAAAAQRAGLRFVVFSDHGDATRRPDPPAYVHGVLCIDAVEISTDGGHVVALNLPQAPYPLGGEAGDVVEDVHRLGGFAIAAHPGSLKPELRWSDWRVPIDGIEWLNADSEWRDDPATRLARVAFAYPVRGAASLAMLLTRPTEVLRRWDQLTTKRRVVTIAGADAHARLGWRPSESSNRGVALSIPSYEQLFRTFSVSLPTVSLSGNAPADGQTVIDAIMHGHVYSSIDALASPVSFAFVAQQGATRAIAGDALAVGDAVVLHAEGNLPPNAEIRLLRDGIILATSRRPSLDYRAGEAGAFRIEVGLRGSRDEASTVPWILTNPIYVGLASLPTNSNRGEQSSSTTSQYSDGRAVDWAVEHSERTNGALDVVKSLSGTELLVRYALTAAPDESAFVAAAVTPHIDLSMFKQLMFVARADRPMRLSVQVRTPKGAAGDRWRRSVYLDQTPRQISIPFDDMMPVGSAPSRHPDLSHVQSVLFVVDTINTKPGASGQFWLDDVRYGR